MLALAACGFLAAPRELRAQALPVTPVASDSLSQRMRDAAARDDAAEMLRLWARGIALPAEGLGRAGRALRAALDTTAAASAAESGGGANTPSGGRERDDSSTARARSDSITNEVAYAATELLKEAAAASAHDVVAWALKQRDVNVNDPYRIGPRAGSGFRALHAAALRGDTLMLRMLLAAGADPFAPDAAGRSAFRVAVDSNATPAVLRILAGPEARLGIRDREDMTTLDWAIAKHPQVAGLLLDAGASTDAPPDGWGPLYFAARDCRGAILYRLLRNGLAPDAGVPNDWRPLTLAARNNCVYEALTLRSFGAELRLAGPEGDAVAVARAQGHEALATLLERAGPPDPALLMSLAARAGAHAHVEALRRARVPLRGAPGKPPVALAASRGEWDMVLWLLAAGAEPDGVDSLGATALHYAARDGAHAVVAQLLRHQVAIERKVEGFTALHLAVLRGQWPSTMLLVNAGASREARNAEDKTAADIARANDDAMLAAYLDAPRRDALLPEAAWAGLDSVVARELASGVSPDALSLGGMTGLELAARRGHRAIVARLLRAGASTNTAAATVALTKAVERRDSVIVELLLAAKVPLAAPDAERDPLAVAAIMPAPGLAKRLLEAGADPARLGNNRVLIAWAEAPLAPGVDALTLSSLAIALGLQMPRDGAPAERDPRETLVLAALRSQDVRAWPSGFVHRAARIYAGAGYAEAFAAVSPALDADARADALLLAAQNGHTRILLEAFARGADPERPGAMLPDVSPQRTRRIADVARASNQPGPLLAALLFGAQVDTAGSTALRMLDQAGWTGLTDALRRRDPAAAVIVMTQDAKAMPVLRRLQREGRLPALPDSTWPAVVRRALALGDRDLAYALLADGVPEPVAGLADQLRLGRAAAVGNVAALRRLLAKGVDPNTALVPGQSALEEAILGAQAGDDGETIRLLLEAGASVERLSALHLSLAARGSQERTALALLARGVPTTYGDEDGLTILDHAARNGLFALSRELIARGVGMKPAPDSGEGGFERAALRGHTMLALALACADAPGRKRALAALPARERPRIERADCASPRVQTALAAADSAHRSDLERSSLSASARRERLSRQRQRMLAAWGDSTEALRRIEVLLGRAYADAGGFAAEELNVINLYHRWPDASPDAVAFRLERARVLRAQGVEWAARAELDALGELATTLHRADSARVPLPLMLRVQLERVDLLAEQGDIREAESRLDEAVALLPLSFSPEVMTRGVYVANLITLRAARPQARRLIATTRGLLDSTAIVDRALLHARLLDFEAQAALQQGDTAAARLRFAQALTRGREVWGVESGNFAATLVRAGALAARDSSPAAAALIAVGTEITERVDMRNPQMARVRLQAMLAAQRLPGRRFTTAYGAAGFLALQAKTDAEQLPLASRWPYLDLNYSLVRDALLGPFDAAESRIIQDEMVYEPLARWKGMLLESLRADRSRAEGRDADDLQHELEQLASVRRAMSSWTARRPRTDSLEWRHGMRRLTSYKELLERERAAAARNVRGDFADPLSFEPAKDLLRAMSADEAWVDIYRFGSLGAEQRYEAFVVTPGRAVQRIPLGNAAAIDSLATRWRRSAVAGADAADEWTALQQSVWAPLAAAVAGRTRLYVGADAALVTLPLGLLSADTTQRVSLVSGPRELLRLLQTRGARATAPTAAPAAATAGAASAAPTLLVVGDPAFGSGAEASKEFVPLPGTAVEARTITQLARRSGARVTLLMGDSATDVAVLDALPEQRLIHVATHGFFGGSEGSAAGTRGVVAAAPAAARPSTRNEGPPRNPMLESGLAFAGANLAATSGAGRITAEELLSVDLSRAQLVVLSACETGLGAQVAGQGVLGLQSAILAAGARGVVMSLWKVPDESTALLMTEFYRGLLTLKLSPAAALSRAQGIVRSNPRFRAPVHWAAWVLTGDVF